MFFRCTTYQADCMLFGVGPLMKVFFNVSKEAPNYDGQELKQYVPPVHGIALRGGREGMAGEVGKEQHLGIRYMVTPHVHCCTGQVWRLPAHGIHHN